MLNLDSRSLVLNTENGIIMESGSLAEELRNTFRDTLENNVYKLSLEKRFLRWTNPETGEIFKGEPEVGGLRRFGVWLLSLLPIESQL